MSPRCIVLRSIVLRSIILRSIVLIIIISITSILITVLSTSPECAPRLTETTTTDRDTTHCPLVGIRYSCVGSLELEV